MIGNGKPKNVKISIEIYMLDDGNIAVKSSSNSTVTTLGLIEAAKAVYISSSQQEPEDQRIHRL